MVHINVKIHNKSFESKTDNTFNIISEYDEEIEIQNQCNICGKTFEENLGLKLHVEDMHKNYFFL